MLLLSLMLAVTPVLGRVTYAQEYEDEEDWQDVEASEDPEGDAEWNDENSIDDTGWVDEDFTLGDDGIARDSAGEDDLDGQNGEDGAAEQNWENDITGRNIETGSQGSSGDAQVWPEAPELDGEAVVLMEANTQAMLYEKNATQQMYPASTTKILTAIVVLEHCSLDEMVTFTEECCDLEDGAVTIDSVPGEQMVLKDVMYGLLLPSGNDCAMALALHVAGSVDAFVDLMNEKAREIGALSSHFANPSGLFNSSHYTTASDLALIARYAFQNSTFVDIISHPTYIIEPTNMNPESRVLTNTHEMITPGNPDYNSDVIGGKTGYLYEAGRCLVTYAERNGITLLAVILDGSYYGIFSETQELLDFGWNHFTIINVSENERRFSFAEEDARVQIDSANQILTLNNVPFYDLTSKVNYAYYLDQQEYAKAKLDAGITEGDPRQLYAWIDYSYAGHYLGSCNIFINPALQTSSATFIHVLYINIWLVLLIVVLVAAAIGLLIRTAKKSQTRTLPGYKSHRRKGHGHVRYYNRSDSIDLRSQYVRSGDRDRRSVHELEDIGVVSRVGEKAVPYAPRGESKAQSARVPRVTEGTSRRRTESEQRMTSARKQAASASAAQPRRMAEVELQEPVVQLRQMAEEEPQAPAARVRKQGSTADNAVRVRRVRPSDKSAFGGLHYEEEEPDPEDFIRRYEYKRRT